MTQFFAAVIAVCKAISVLKELLDKFMVFYVQTETENLHTADRAAMRKAIDEQDQRDLEKQIGNKNPGEPSGTPGTVIRDTLPNVLPTNKG